MLTTSMLVLGMVSLSRLPLTQYPSISSDGIRVTVDYPSSAPEEIERAITIPLEESLATLNNIERISSESSDDEASVRVDFKPGTDMDLAGMEMRDRVDQVRALLPDDVDRIRIFRWQSDQSPILYINVAWRGAGDRLFDIVRKVLEPRLLRIDGVANVIVEGMEEKQLIVALDQERLEALDVGLSSLAQEVRENNLNVSLGHVIEGGQRYLVRALGEFRGVDEIGRLPLRGRNLRVADVADVTYDYPEKKRFERLNGADAVSLEIFKSSAANIVEVSGRARGVLDRIEQDYGEDLDIEIVRDRAESVLEELEKLRHAAYLGAALAIGIIFLFLRNARSTLVIAVAIPISVFCVFTGMYMARALFGSTVTLNMVSMMGLMLAVGMLVDPAVVTLESIFRRSEEEGADPRAAALGGSREVGMAVLASALTTMCVFIPFFFFSQGRTAVWMRDAGLTICLAVVVSMLVALSVIPAVSSRLFRGSYSKLEPLLRRGLIALLIAGAAWRLHEVGWNGFRRWVGQWSGRIGDTFGEMETSTVVVLAVVMLLLLGMVPSLRRCGMRAGYVRLLEWTLRHRAGTLLAALIFLGTGIFLYLRIEQRGTPWTPTRRVEVTVEVERSYSLAEVAAHFSRIEQLVLAKQSELDVESLSTRFRQRGGRITAYLVDADVGRLTTMQASNAIRKLLPPKVGVRYKMGRQRGWSGPQLGVEVILKGRDPDVLAILAEEVASYLGRLPGVQDVDTSLEDGEEEIQVTVDREEAIGYGLSPRGVAGTIATALGTRRTSRYKAEEREIDIVLQLQKEDRISLEQLRNNRFEGRDGTRIQLASVAEFRFRKGPKSLQREDRQLRLSVFANTESRSHAYRITEPISTMMESIALPPGYSWDLGRAARYMREDTADTNFTLFFAIFLIYLITASLFESLIHPFTILLSIPFSLIGVGIGLYLTDMPLDNNGVLGLLILFGIVVNNGIVLIDHFNHYRREGMSRHDAIIRGGKNRLRPILMTACTTILNLMPIVLPMVYGTSEGFARRWGPIGLVVVCGLATSTILTLIFAPTIYSLLDDLSLWSRRVVWRAVRR